ARGGRPRPSSRQFRTDRDRLSTAPLVAGSAERNARSLPGAWAMRTEPQAPTRVLLTGGTGFIGRHVHASLVARGIAVRTIGRKAPPSGRGRSDHRTVDVRQDFTAEAHGCDAIVHLAGLSDASASYERPIEFAEVNVIGTLRALEA